MKWVVILVAVLMVALFIESKLEKKMKKDRDSVEGGDVYSPGELIGELKSKQDGK